MVSENDLATVPESAFAYPVNKVGQRLLSKSIKELVTGDFLETGVYDLVNFYANHDLNPDSTLPRLIELCGYKIIAEIKNIDLLYEVCRRNPSIEQMCYCLEGIYGDIESQKLIISTDNGQSIAMINSNYGQEIDRRLLAFRYLNNDFNKIKAKKDQLIAEWLSSAEYKIQDCLKKGDICRWLDLHLLVGELIKRDANFRNIDFTDNDIDNIDTITTNILNQRLKECISQIADLKANISWVNQCLFVTKKRHSKKANCEARIEEIVTNIQPELISMILDAILYSTERCYLTKI